MIDSDFNTFNTEIQQKQNKAVINAKDERKTLVVFMLLLIGQTMCILNTLINNFTLQTFKIQYPLLYYGGFYFLFFVVWMCINRKITEPKRYYYLIIILETQSFFFDYLANFSYTSQFDVIKNKKDEDKLLQNTTNPYNNEIFISEYNNTLDKDNKFINSYPAYIYFPIQFIVTLLIFLLFIRKNYYLQKKHYISLFFGIISVFLFSYFYITNYFKDSLLTFNEFKTGSKVKVIIFSLISNILLSLSYIFQEYFFKSGKEIYEFFPYKAFLSMLILAFESFCVGEFKFINRNILSNNDIIINFIYFCLINGIYLSVIPFLIKHITSIILVTNYINYLFYYYMIYLSKNNFIEKYGLLLILGLIFNLFSFYIFVKYKIKKSYQNLKEEVEKSSIGSLLYNSDKYDINKAETTGTTNVEMNLQISNNPLGNSVENNNN